MHEALAEQVEDKGQARVDGDVGPHRILEMVRHIGFQASRTSPASTLRPFH